MKPNLITISEIEILSFGTPGTRRESESTAGRYGDTPDRQFHFQHPESADPGLPTAVVRIACSKGTYIRAIARDLGLALDTGAYMSALTRTASGPFHVSDSLSLDQALALL